MRTAPPLVTATISLAAFCLALIATCRAQDRYATATPPTATPFAAPPLAAQQPQAASAEALAAAQFEGAQVIAYIDGQVVLACDVLWRVNLLIEANKAQRPEFGPEQWAELRGELMKREVAAMVDRKLLFMQFRRDLPDEAWQQIEENLREPFEEMEMPQLKKQLKVDTPQEVERELTRLGSSMTDVRRAFNERAIASELLRSKIKINEEVSPEEMLNYYQAHLTDYEYPTRARWEELMVSKSRFDHPSEAFAEIARMGNEVWQRAAQQQGVQGAVFTEVAKAKSDGFTAKEGGQHDWTTKGALKATVIDEWLFSKGQVGQLSPILDSGPAFHIVRVLERQEAGRRPFTEVQGDIRDKLKEERFDKGVQEHLAKLRKDARIWTVFTGNVTADQLMNRPGAGAAQRR